MAELQTIEEIRAAHDGEWVAVVDCEYDESGKLVRGRVAVHSSKRSDVYRQLPANTSGAIECFGKVPDDIIYMLWNRPARTSCFSCTGTPSRDQTSTATGPTVTSRPSAGAKGDGPSQG